MTFPWSSTPPTEPQRAAFADATVRPYWLDALPPRDPRPSLEGPSEADLCIVGGGFTGLWAALHAKADDPSPDVVVLETETVGFGASGRNGGFALGSLTHGIENGLARFADEMPQLERLGRENFEGFVADIERLGIDCGLELTGDLAVALEPHEVGWLEEHAHLFERFGHEHELFDREAVRAEVASPTYIGGLWDKTDAALVDPGRLAAGLADAALAAGVRLHERSPATKLEDDGAGVRVLTSSGHVRARRVLLATSAYPPLLRAIGRYIAPVYDYVLMTEPLTPPQRDSIGWKRRQGIGDCANQFHYYRLTQDERILWGGYDAVYRYGGPARPRRRAGDVRQALAALLHDLSAARGHALHASLGRRHRHVQPLLGLLRDRPGRPGRLCGWLHGARRRLDALRRARGARPAGRAGDRRDASPLRALEAGALPAGAASLGRDPAHQEQTRRGRPKRGRPRPLAPRPRPARPRLRQLTAGNPFVHTTDVGEAG
jgi:glycine/D-amino acid oxidase-like deaminating enzyme